MRHGPDRGEKRDKDTYPVALASHNIKEIAHERKAGTKKYKNRRQEIAVGIAKARRGERM